MTRKNTTVEGDPDCTEVLEDDSRSIILDIIAQLRKGTDLHRVALPTFVLEPRSMLERITDFMSHPDLIQAWVTFKDDPWHQTSPVFFYSPLLCLLVACQWWLHVILYSANAYTDPLDRFIGVVQYFLSGWHIKPKVKMNHVNDSWHVFNTCSLSGCQKAI